MLVCSFDLLSFPSTLVDWTVDVRPETIAPPSFGEEESRRAWMLDLENIGLDANKGYRPTCTDAEREVPVHA